MKRSHSGSRRNSFAHRNSSYRSSAVSIGKIYEQDVNGNISVQRRVRISSLGDVGRRQTFRSHNEFKPVIRRSNSWRLAIETKDHERQKELNQLAPILRNSRPYKSVIIRSNSRGLVTESTYPERQNNASLRTATLSNSSDRKPVISRSNSRGLVTESTYPERQNNASLRTSNALGSNASKSLINSRDIGRDSRHNGHKVLGNYRPEVTIGDEYHHDATHGPAVQGELPHFPSAVDSSTCKYSEPFADSGSQSERRHPVRVRIVGEYQLRINRNDHGVSDVDSGGGKGSHEAAQCVSGPSGSALKWISGSKKPLHKAEGGQKVRGDVTVRPLTIESKLVINRHVSQCPPNDSTDLEVSRKVTQRPLMVDAGTSRRPVIDWNGSQYTADNCANRQGRMEVTHLPLRDPSADAHLPVTRAVTEADSECEWQAGRGVEPGRQREPSQATVRWFLCASTLVWVFSFFCVFIKRLYSV